MAQTKAGAVKQAAQHHGLTVEAYLQKLADGLHWCTLCRQWKPVGEFVKDASRNDGVSAKCWRCASTTTRPGPTIRERREQRASGFEWCRGCKKWLPSTDVRSGVCQPCANQEAAARYASDPSYRSRRREHAHSRKRGTDPISEETKAFLMAKYHGRCAYCDAPATTFDHLVPVSLGGDARIGNIVPACRSHNSAKKDSDVFDWIEQAGLADKIDSDVIEAAVGAYYVLR
jgi:hypothetical protein